MGNLVGILHDMMGLFLDFSESFCQEWILLYRIVKCTCNVECCQESSACISVVLQELNFSVCLPKVEYIFSLLL